MDTDALELLRRIGAPVRIPTVTWLFSDVFNLIDVDARALVSRLIDTGAVVRDSGGWIVLTSERSTGEMFAVDPGVRT